MPVQRAVTMPLTLTLLLAVSTVVGAERRAFTVADSIAWSHLIAFSNAGGSGRDPHVSFSPQGDAFVVQTRRGDLERNVNIDTLFLFTTAEAERLLKERSARPYAGKQHVLAQSISVHDCCAMSNVQWIGDGEVAFTAEGDNGKNQIFTVNSATRHPTQLTRHPTSVASFSAAGDRIVFYAHVAPAPPENAVIVNQDLGDTAQPESEDDLPLELFQLSRSTGVSRRIDAPAVRLLDVYRKIWIAPSARYAVSFAPATDAPEYWAQYRMRDYDLFGYKPARARSDPTSWDLIIRTRYQLLDLVHNSARPLLDAPSGAISRNGTPMAVFWPPDERTVIVSSTYLPFAHTSVHEHSHRIAGPAIAEVNLTTGAVSPISYEPVLTTQQLRGGKRLEPIVAIDWSADEKRLFTSVRRVDGSVTRTAFESSRGRWHLVRGLTRSRGAQSLSIVVGETANERARVIASDLACECKITMFDPNPNADELTFGRVEALEWDDPKGRLWRGGLVYPPSYQVGKAYPLVVQTHGFNANEFLIDGPNGTTTSMAAQPLANSGFLVLQVRENAAAITTDDQEGPAVADGYKAGIDLLVSRGLVDSKRIGLIGFSRTGNHALHALARYPDLFGAADIAAATQPSYLQYLMTVNSSVDFVQQQRRLSGGAPPEVGYGKWFNESPLYGLRNTRVAIRLQAIDLPGLLGMWDTYAVLREANRAVDFMYYPNGSHLLRKPAERLASQGGAVDWFRFWLQGALHSTNGRESDFARWKELRKHAGEDSR